MTGLGGIVGHRFRPLAEQAADHPGARVLVDVSGQIIDYHLDKVNRGGRLEAITYVARRLVTPSGNIPREDTIAIKVSGRGG